MAKKLELKTKLTETDSPQKAETQDDNPNLVRKVRTYPRSYRWREYDMKVIEELTEKINQVSSQKMDATKILRGVLHLAKKQSPKKLIEAIFEAEKNAFISKYK
jgi:hypothetical protein